MRQNLELSNQSSGQQLQSDASARKELQATLEAVAAREAAAKRALDDAARDKAAQDVVAGTLSFEMIDAFSPAPRSSERPRGGQRTWRRSSTIAPFDFHPSCLQFVRSSQLLGRTLDDCFSLLT